MFLPEYWRGGGLWTHGGHARICVSEIEFHSSREFGRENPEGEGERKRSHRETRWGEPPKSSPGEGSVPPGSQISSLISLRVLTLVSVLSAAERELRLAGAGVPGARGREVGALAVHRRR